MSWWAWYISGMFTTLFLQVLSAVLFIAGLIAFANWAYNQNHKRGK
jgi:hypothetical protein